ncbi:membrane protein [Ligilactobacillus salitolerans]|uniref:Membrane protein n=1 Tax=Ligilactobacillus salitolerans TaxID=1808352 RepID=A0A401IVZ5_9LACO|nr:AEC family transporter [Ligilactobacillus salitolerans]GBG95692.1 membrane protein [Ligilactobacillus salitolerans]
MGVFEQVMLPVLLIFLVGFIFQKIFRLEIKPLSTVAIYLLLPFLVFKTFYEAHLDQGFLDVVWTSLLIMGALLILGIILGIIIGKVFHYDRQKLCGFLLATVFPNSGNYGVPIIIFAFGQRGVEYAMAIMVFHNILMGVVGVYIAAAANQSGKQGIKAAGLAILKQPMNYVIIPAILLNLYQIKLSANLMKSVNMIGNITIPLIMLILGMQLAGVTVGKVSLGNVSLAMVMRLLVSPFLAYVICTIFGLSTIITAVIVLMAAMPSAANTTMYAIQFDADPDFVSTCTLISTLCSIGTLTVLLNIF